MRFIFPNKQYEQQAKDYISEFHAHASDINGTGGLDSYLKQRSYDEWLLKIRSDLDLANIPPDRVPSITYFYVRETDNRIVGMINIRLALNDFLRIEGGHIGYSIRPTERRKHYASDMVRQALDFCKRIGLCDVLICCERSNLASAGVIRNCGGTLEAEFYSKTFHETLQRYRILQT